MFQAQGQMAYRALSERAMVRVIAHTTGSLHHDLLTLTFLLTALERSPPPASAVPCLQDGAVLGPIPPQGTKWEMCSHLLSLVADVSLFYGRSILRVRELEIRQP